MKYESRVTLGRKYKESTHGVVGIVTAVSFFEHGCERVNIQWMDGAQVSEMPVDAVDLGPEPATSVVLGEDHESDIILGKKYVDTRTGVEGTAVTVTFYPNSCERVSMEWLDETRRLQYETFDAPRLELIDTGEKAGTKKTGGPAKGVSHLGRGPVGRPPRRV